MSENSCIWTCCHLIAWNPSVWFWYCKTRDQVVAVRKTALRRPCLKPLRTAAKLTTPKVAMWWKRRSVNRTAILSLTCVKGNLTIHNLQHSIHILNCLTQIFKVIVRGSWFSAQRSSQVTYSFPFYNHFPRFWSLFSLCIGCHVHAEAVLQRARLAASGACRDGSNKCQPGGGPQELHLRSKKKGDT